MLWAFRDRMLDLKNDRRFRYILIFKNHGEAAGASLEHPHSQLIALPIVPKRVREEVDASQALLRREGALHFLRHDPPGDRIRRARDSARTIISLPSRPTRRGFRSRPGFCRKQHGSAFENIPTPFTAGLAQVLQENLARLDAVLWTGRRTTS